MCKEMLRKMCKVLKKCSISFQVQMDCQDNFKKRPAGSAQEKNQLKSI